VTQLEDYELHATFEGDIEIHCAKHGFFDIEVSGARGWPTMRDVHHAIAAHEAAHHPLRAVVNRLEERMKA